MAPKIESPPESAQMKAYSSLAEVKEEVMRKGRKLVVRGANVYDVNDFLEVVKHPGGKGLIEQELGQDITLSMRNNHHSKAAYEILELYKVGYIEGVKPPDEEPVQNSRLENLNIDPKNLQTALKKIDLKKGIIAQIWRMELTGEEYMAFVHDPKVLVKEPKLFDSPLLDRLTRTSWYTIVIYWIPVLTAMGIINYNTSISWFVHLALFIAGMMVWSFLEYTIHRFLFHAVENNINAGRIVRTFHFLFHGIHHAYPLDKSRVVFPIVPSSVVVAVAHAILYPYLGYPNFKYFFIIGIVFGYMMYDVVHFHIHHSRADSWYIKQVKKIHNKHHYRNPNRGFGVTSTFWDHVFGTVLA